MYAGQFIRKMRKKEGLSAKQLSKKSGKGKNTVSLIEANIYFPSERNFLDITRQLNMDDETAKEKYKKLQVPKHLEEKFKDKTKEREDLFVDDDKLSWKAKGILLYLLRYSDWKVSDLVKYASDGKKSVYSGLKELQENGYLSKEQNKYILNCSGGNEDGS